MKATITTITPVHIGSGITYNKNIDFFQIDDKIGIIDENKVLQFIDLGNIHLENIHLENIHQWTAAIEKGDEEFKNLLNQRGWKGDLHSICSRIMPLRNVQNNATQLKEAMRNTLKGLYIPGSSLKGAIRTAIFNDFLDEDFLMKITINDIKDKNKFKDTKIISTIFGNEAKENSMRFLKISDINFDGIEAEVHELKILNKEFNTWDFKKDQQILIEAITANATASFDFVIDKNLLEKNIEYDLKEKKEFEKNPKNKDKRYKLKWPYKKINFFKEPIAKFCETINFFTQKKIIDEYNLFYDEHEDGYIQDTTFIEKYDEIYYIFDNLQPNEFIIRVGGNSGYVFTTGKWVDNEGMQWEDEAYNALRKTVQKNDYTDMDLWPKTRKISTTGQIFGFVKITLNQ